MGVALVGGCAVLAGAALAPAALAAVNALTAVTAPLMITAFTVTASPIITPPGGSRLRAFDVGVGFGTALVAVALSNATGIITTGLIGHSVARCLPSMLAHPGSSPKRLDSRVQWL
jgi:hypothetical protein